MNRLLVIHANNGAELTRAVRGYGYSPKGVFLKAYEDFKKRYGKYGALPYSHFDDSEDLKRQFGHLASLHRVAPDRIVQPIALVEGNGNTIGYLARRATGMSLEEMWTRAHGTDADSARFASLFRRAAYEVITTLQILNYHGLAHGDAERRNVKASRSTGRIKLFDPMYRASAAEKDTDAIKALFDDIAELLLARQ